MPGVRKYILNKLAEGKTLVAAEAVEYLSLIEEFSDEDSEELQLQCIQVLAYRLSPLSRLEALGLSSTMTSAVALARERVRLLFYNPNYWKVRISNALCPAVNQHCSDGVFSAMTRQMSNSTNLSKSGPEPNLIQVALDGMCTACRSRYALSVKRHVDLEIKKCLGEASKIEELGPRASVTSNDPQKPWLKCCN
jgi:hypothetical protein